MNNKSNSEYKLFKSQLHKQLYEINKNLGIDDLLKYINDNDNKKKANKKNRKGYSKKTKQRKNSDEIVIDKFNKNLKNHSTPLDKVVKIKPDINKNWVSEIIKKSY